jgi:hypothetical protein
MIAVVATTSTGDPVAGQEPKTVGVAEAARRLQCGPATVRRAFEEDLPESGYVIDSDGRTGGKERRIFEAWLAGKVRDREQGVPIRKRRPRRRRATAPAVG